MRWSSYFIVKERKGVSSHTNRFLNSSVFTIEELKNRIESLTIDHDKDNTKSAENEMHSFSKNYTDKVQCLPLMRFKTLQ
ncbi:MAG: hypothetical protein WBF33_13165 [Candidatus Nitrosopolaris sp.]|jgi:hypothetical protein